jgi:hypothetical protein
MSLWDALRMNMMISYQELIRTFPNTAFNHPCILQCSDTPIDCRRRQADPIGDLPLRQAIITLQERKNFFIPCVKFHHISRPASL